MKLLKGLVLTMLVSTATIFSMETSFCERDPLTTDGLTSGQTGVKTTGLGTVGDSLGNSQSVGDVVDESTTFADTVGQTSVIALSPVEVSTTILTRLANNDSLDENTSSVLSTVLSSLGKGTKGTVDAITALTELTSGNGEISVGIYTTLRSVLDVLTSEVIGTPIWNVTTTGVITPSSVVSTDFDASKVDSLVDSGSAVGTSQFTVTTSELAAINLSRGISSTVDALSSFTLSTLLKTNISKTAAGNFVESMFRSVDRLETLTNGGTLVDSDDDTGTHGATVDDLSSSVMELGLGTGGNVVTSTSGISRLASTTRGGGQIVDDSDRGHGLS